MSKKKIFDKVHYESGDGMLTTVWGPSLWHSIHTISFNYPINPTRKDKKNYKNWIISLKYVLPCKHCRNNLVKNFKKMPLLNKHMKNRHTFSKYIYDLHELINKMLNKKSGLSYQEVKDRYENFRARCNKLPFLIKNEKGCTDSIYGIKSKCVIKIVPQNSKCKTFHMNKKCKARRLTRKKGRN